MRKREKRTWRERYSLEACGGIPTEDASPGREGLREEREAAGRSAGPLGTFAGVRSATELVVSIRTFAVCALVLLLSFVSRVPSGC